MPKKIIDIPYLKIMGKAFSLTWKNRYLGWFGFFVLLSNIGSFNYSSNDLEKNYPKLALENVAQYPLWIFIGIFILCLIFIALAILSIISRGALISSLSKLRKNAPTNLKEGFRDGKKYFGKIFLISFFSGLFILAALLILAPPVAFLFWNHNYLLGVIMAIVAAIIFLPLIVLVAYLRIFGYLYAVLGGLKSWAAIENAYALFRKNIGVSLVMALFFVPLNILFFLVVFFALIPIALAVLPLGIILFIFAGGFGAGIAGVIGLAILIIFALFLRSFMEVFAQAAWILFFHEIATPTEKEPVSEPIIAAETLPKPMPTINSERE